MTKQDSDAMKAQRHMRQPQAHPSGILGTGIRVNVTDQAALLEDVEDHLRARRGFRIATLNLDHVVKLRKSSAFATAYRAQSHITADGNPIVWASRLAGQDVSLLPGSELVLPLVRCAASCDVPVVLLGSSESALKGAAQALVSNVPGLEIAQCIAPPMDFDPEGEIARSYVDRLQVIGPALCFLALGAPKQEIFAAFASRHLPQTGFVSVGAGLDFLSGHQVRAPRLARVLAMEWAWRLAQSPRRMAGRYAACFAVLPHLLVDALVLRWRGRAND